MSHRAELQIPVGGEVMFLTNNPAGPGFRSHLCSYIVLSLSFYFLLKRHHLGVLLVKHPGNKLLPQKSLRVGKSLISVWIRNAFLVSLNAPGGETAQLDGSISKAQHQLP